MNHFTASKIPGVFGLRRYVPDLVLTLIFMLVGLVSQAQFQKPEVGMPTPNAASLGLFGKVPVSLYTGTPNIDVPVYTVETGKIKVPISLSYHASGVRVNQHPGWVGLNWNLNAGGAITRVVKGYQDEVAVPNATDFGNPNNPKHLGYYYKSSYLDNSTWDSEATIENLYPQPISGVGFSKLYADLQPDEFNFNFLGYSGKFYMNPDRTWAVVCDAAIQVELLETKFTKPPTDLKMTIHSGASQIDRFYFYSFNGFRLTAPDGTKYEFGGHTDAIEFSLPFFANFTSDETYANAPGAGWMADTWHLRKITSPEGKVVDFEYQVFSRTDGKFIASFYRSLTESNTEGTASIKSKFLGILPLSDVIQCASTSSNQLDSAHHYNGVLQRPSYLKEIRFDKGKVVFGTELTKELKYKPHLLTARLHGKYLPDARTHPEEGQKTLALIDYLTGLEEDGTQSFYCQGCIDENAKVDMARRIIDRMKWRKLTSIQVISNQNLAGAKFELKYADDSTQRLSLSQLNKVSLADTACREFHKFSYHQSTAAASKLPDYLDRKDQTDHWGFFNGDASYNLYNFPVGYDVHKNAATSIDVLKEGSLYKIEYPTGGYTQLEYEPHDAYKYQRFNQNGSVDLQANTMAVGGIRLRKISNHDGQSLKTTEYEYKFSDNGTTKSSGILNGKPQYQYSIDLKAILNDGNYSIDYISSQNTLPLSQNSLGAHIGYREVKEKFADGSYKIHQFSNYESSDGISHLDEAIGAANRTQNDAGVYDEKNSLALERGKLLNEKTYNNAGFLLAQRIIRYQRYNTTFARALFANIVSICTDPSSASVEAVQAYAYKNYAFQYLPSIDSVYLYDEGTPGKFTLDETTYVYNGIGLPTEVKTTRSGKFTRRLTRYVYDYNTPGTPGSEQAASIYIMKGLGMTAVPVEQQVRSNESGSESMADGYLNFFRRYTPKAGFYNIQVEKTYRFANAQNAAGVNVSGIANGTFISDPGYSYLTVDFGNDVNSGYNVNGEPVKFKGADGIENTFKWFESDANRIGLLESKKAGDQETTYQYANPLQGVSRINDLNMGTWTDYTYDGFSRLSTIRDYKGNLVQSFTYNLKNSSGCPTRPEIVIGAGSFDNSFDNSFDKGFL